MHTRNTREMGQSLVVSPQG